MVNVGNRRLNQVLCVLIQEVYRSFVDLWSLALSLLGSGVLSCCALDLGCVDSIDFSLSDL